MGLCVWNMSLGGEDMQTTCDVFLEPGLSEQAAADALANFWENGLAFLMSDELTLPSITLFGEVYTYSRAGSITRESVPSNVAVIMRKKVVGGNSGRFFIPGITDANVDNAGRLDAAFKNSFATNMAAARAALSAVGVTLRVEQSDGSFIGVSDITVAPVVGTQRRRLARR